MFFSSPRQKARQKSQELPPLAGRTHPPQTPNRTPTKAPARGSGSNLEYYYPQGYSPSIVRPGGYSGGQKPKPLEGHSKKRASRLSTGPGFPPPPPTSTPQRQRRTSAVPPSPGAAAFHRSEYAPPQDSRPRISSSSGPSPGVRRPKKKKVHFGPYDGLSRYPSEYTCRLHPSFEESLLGLDCSE